MTHTPRSGRLAALPLVLGLAACASAGAGPRPALLPTGWTPPAGQRCEVDELPASLPSVSQVVDSASLAGELAGAAAGYALFTVGYDTLGLADTVRLTGGDLPHTTQTAWLGAVSSRVRERSPIPVPQRRGRPQGWSVLLRVDAGDPPTFRMGRTESCPPVLTNTRTVARYAQDLYSGLVRQNPEYRRLVTVTLRMRVDSTGRVVRADPLPSAATGEVEGIARMVGLQATFKPALLNRRPVAVWVQLPIGFTVAPTRGERHDIRERTPSWR